MHVFARPYGRHHRVRRRIAVGHDHDAGWLRVDSVESGAVGWHPIGTKRKCKWYCRARRRSECWSGSCRGRQHRRPALHRESICCAATATCASSAVTITRTARSGSFAVAATGADTAAVANSGAAAEPASATRRLRWHHLEHVRHVSERFVHRPWLHRHRRRRDRLQEVELLRRARRTPREGQRTHATEWNRIRDQTRGR